MVCWGRRVVAGGPRINMRGLLVNEWYVGGTGCGAGGPRIDMRGLWLMNGVLA
ncbi:MAG: hypothetical protein GY869_32310 [Planctomycetes bacterium]|nr:hypothetical protein [Planctomycetota bacterium]